MEGSGNGSYERWKEKEFRTISQIPCCYTLLNIVYKLIEIDYQIVKITIIENIL